MLLWQMCELFQAIHILKAEMDWLSAVVSHLGDRRIDTATSSPSTDSSSETQPLALSLLKAISLIRPSAELFHTSRQLGFVLPVGSGTGNAWSTPQPSITAVYCNAAHTRSITLRKIVLRNTSLPIHDQVNQHHTRSIMLHNTRCCAT
jgi:hypothetical protein